MEFHFVVKTIKEVTKFGHKMRFYKKKFYDLTNFVLIFLFASFFFLIEPEKYKIKDKDRERPYYNNIKEKRRKKFNHNEESVPFLYLSIY